MNETLRLIGERDMPRPDMTILALARMAFEDFRQILILCSNGETTGGMKILRGMFERVVTAMYLHKHPEEADAFINFFPISQYKLARAAEFFNLSDEVIAQIRAERDAVISRYKVIDCKKCGTERENHTWTKTDLVAMAKKVGLELPMPMGYYLPMQETHATMGSIIRRFKLSEAAQCFVYDETEDPNDRIMTLVTAHYLLLGALQTLRDHFRLEESINDRFGRCLEDFNQIWQKSAPGFSRSPESPEFTAKEREEQSGQ